MRTLHSIRSWLARRPDGTSSYTCPTLGSFVPVTDRQERVLGWSQDTVRASTILVIGAGGLGGEIGEGLVQKGYGQVHFCDGDIVTPTNLARQKFDKASLYHNKAVELARVLRGRGYVGTHLVGHPCHSPDLAWPQAHAVVCGVDRTIPGTRLLVSFQCRERRMPAVILGATRDADGGYVFVQEAKGGPCWSCLFKPELEGPSVEGPATCAPTAATVDILKALAGPALYALDSLLMARPRDWNYWSMSLSQGGVGGAQRVERRPSCPYCQLLEITP